MDKKPVITLAKDEQTGSITMFRDGRPMMCPFRQPLVFQQKNLAGQVQVSIQEQSCGDWCSLFNRAHNAVTLHCGKGVAYEVNESEAKQPPVLTIVDDGGR